MLFTFFPLTFFAWLTFPIIDLHFACSNESLQFQFGLVGSDDDILASRWGVPLGFVCVFLQIFL
eukprot:jgi/Botrbrau1/4624/Bobra.60_2s0107.1